MGPPCEPAADLSAGLGAAALPPPPPPPDALTPWLPSVVCVEERVSVSRVMAVGADRGTATLCSGAEAVAEAGAEAGVSPARAAFCAEGLLL